MKISHDCLLLRLIPALAFCLITSNFLKAQDIIYKKDNSTINAKVLEVNATSVVYKLFDYPDGPLITISKDDISVIVYQNGSHEVFNQTGVAADTVHRLVPARTRNFKNLIFGELGGNGGIYSLNYERRFRLANRLSMAARIGYSGLPAGSGNNGTSISEYRDCQTIPLSVSLLCGKTYMFEGGVGYTPLILTEKNLLYDFRSYVAPFAGYRYQDWSKRFCFRAGVVIGLEADRYPIYPLIALPYFAWGFSF